MAKIKNGQYICLHLNNSKEILKDLEKFKYPIGFSGHPSSSDLFKIFLNLKGSITDIIFRIEFLIDYTKIGNTERVNLVRARNLAIKYRKELVDNLKQLIGID